MNAHGRAGALLATASVTLLAGLWVQPTATAAANPRARPPHGTPPVASTPATPGAQLWVNRFDGPGHGNDQAMAVGASPDGSKVFVTGYSTISADEADMITFAYDASTGRRLWASRYANATGYALGVSPGGSKVFVAGSVASPTSGGDYLTVAYDAGTGKQLWAARFTGHDAEYDQVVAVGVSPGGSRVFVTGFANGAGFVVDYVTIAYDAGSGTRLWVQRYTGLPNGEIQVATSIAVSPDGSSVFVTGFSSGSPDEYDYATVAYDAASGRPLWVSRYDPLHADDEARDVRVGPDGTTVYVTGLSMGPTGHYDYATVAYDAATGAQRWVGRYDGPAEGDDYASALEVTPNGAAVFVTGNSEAVDGTTDYATVGYDAATGAQLGVDRYSGMAGGWDYPTALGVSPEGSEVFVSGYSDGAGGEADMTTLAYEVSSGNQLWVRRYAGSSHQGAATRALSVDPDGTKVFVTGGTVGLTLGDYTTVAYSIT